MCDHEDPQGIAYCECDEGFHGYNCELTDAPSPIPQTESQCLKSRCECLNPDTNEMCSGLGKCEKIENDLDWCDCQYVDADGNNVDRFCSNAKGLFGKWCQCNQWLCRQKPEDEMECSGRGYCNCDTHDPNTDTYCECDRGFFGAYCELDHEPPANYTATNTASRNTAARATLCPRIKVNLACG